RLHATAVHFFPLVLLLAWRAAGEPRLRTLALLALVTALQLLAGMYVSYELFALVAAMAPALWWEARRHGRSGVAVAAALAAGAVPGFAAMRAPIRFIVLPLLSLAVLAGMGAAALGEGRRWVRVLTLAAGVAVVLADARPVPIVRLPLHGEAVAAYRWLAEHGEHRPVLELPAFLSPMDLDQLLASGRYMVASTLHWSPLVNGYTGHPPPSYALLATLARRLPDPAALDDLCALVALGWIVV